MAKAVFRNALLSGLLVFSLFLLVYQTAEPGAQNMDDISGWRTTLLVLNAFVLPGFFFGLAMVLALPQAVAWKKLVYIIASTLVYAFVSGAGLEGDYLLLASAALAGPTMVLFTNALLWPGLNSVRQALIALPVSAAAVVPLFYTLQTGGETLQTSDLLGFTSFIFWPVFIAWVLTRFRWPTRKQVKAD